MDSPLRLNILSSPQTEEPIVNHPWVLQWPLQVIFKRVQLVACRVFLCLTYSYTIAIVFVTVRVILKSGFSFPWPHLSSRILILSPYHTRTMARINGLDTQCERIHCIFYFFSSLSLSLSLRTLISTTLPFTPRVRSGSSNLACVAKARYNKTTKKHTTSASLIHTWLQEEWSLGARNEPASHTNCTLCLEVCKIQLATRQQWVLWLGCRGCEERG